jgi:hypothetical protein
MVAAGLVIEYRHLFTGKGPVFGEIGGLFVTVGVAAEVIIGILIAKTSDRLQELANVLISEADVKAARALEAAAEANQIAERERLARLRLEADISPRLFKNQDKAIDRLRQFAGTNVTLAYSPEHESIQTAEQIAYVLKGAGWIVTPMPSDASHPYCRRDGVTVQAVLSSFLPSTFPPGVIPETPQVGAALIEELHKTGIDPRQEPGTTGHVAVYVGRRPSLLESKLLRHSFAAHKAMTARMSNHDAADEMSRLLDAELEQFLKELGPGSHGNREGVPRP